MDSIKLFEGFAALLALLFVYYHIWMKKKGKNKHRPPEPDGGWPVVGHLGILNGTTPLHKTLVTLSEKHGPLFALKLGQMYVIVVSSMDLAKECFTANDRAFASRPPLQSSKCLGYDHAMIGISPYGVYWREVRKVVAIQLLSNRRLELLKHIRVEEVASLVRGLYNSCGGDHPVDMNRRFTSLGMNVVIRMVAGKRYFNSEGDDGGEDEFKEAIREFFRLMGLLTITDAIPWLEWLDIGGHLKAMKRVHKKMKRIVSAWLAEHRQEKKSDDLDVERDFIDVLIKELDDGRLSEKHQTDTIIEATALAMVLAGTDTTTVTLEWTLSLLLNNRHVLQKAQQELDYHVGMERQVEESDINNLPYLQAIVKESMRLYPPLPLLAPHQSIEPVQIGGYHIPVGTTLIVNVWKIFRDPNLWVDPEEFKPERFLISHKEITFDGQCFAFMPFGSGRRMCPGLTMALQVLHLALARLLQSFELLVPNDKPVDMTEGFGLTMPKVAPLQVHLRPRLPPHMYK